MLRADHEEFAFLAGAIIGPYLFVLLMSLFVFEHAPGLSALRAMTASAPSTAFVGTPVLGYLYGDKGDIPISIGSIIIAVVLIPSTSFYSRWTPRPRRRPSLRPVKRKRPRMPHQARMSEGSSRAHLNSPSYGCRF